MRKGQISQNFIIYMILGLLVLVAAIAVSVYGSSLANKLRTIISGASPSSVGEARSLCNNACSNLQFNYPDYDGSADLSKLKYCTATFDISEHGGSSSAHCYNSDILGSSGCRVNDMDIDKNECT